MPSARPGRFFFQFGVMVSAAVLISLFVSFTLDPMLSAVWADPDAAGARGKGPIARFLRAFERGMAALERGYVAVLRWGLSHRWLTLAGAALSFGSTELAPLAGEELACTTPRFLGFWFDEVVCPIDELSNGSPVS